MTDSDRETGGGHIGTAIALMLFAHLLFSFVDTSTKWLLGAGLAVIQLAFMRYFVHFLITLADLRRTRAVPREVMSRKIRWLVILRSLCLIGSTVANFIALGFLPLSITAAIIHLAPVLVCLFAAPILGERVTLVGWCAVFLGFSGVMLIVQPWDGATVNWYAALTLIPAAGMALYSVLTRMLAGQVRPAVLQFYTGALGSVVLLPMIFFTWQTPPSLLAWVLLCGIGAFAWAGHEALTRAHKYASASALAPFGYAFVLYLNIAGWLIFDEVPTIYTLAGSLLIVAAGILIWRLSGSSEQVDKLRRATPRPPSP